MTNHLRRALIGAAGYGAGFAANILFLVILTLFQLFAVLVSISEVQVFHQAIAALLLSVIPFAIAGAIGGAIGGWTVARSNNYLQPRGFIWRSALAFGLAQGILFLPALFFLLLAVFFDETLWYRLSNKLLIGLFLGGIFGALVSFILALLLRLNSRQNGRVVLSGILGFGTGGVLVMLVDHFFPSAPNIGLMVLFGAAGGAMLGHVLSRETPFDRDLTEDRGRHVWLARLEIALGIFIGVMALYLGYNVVNAARVNLVPLNSVISQGTTGTQWREQALPSITPANQEAIALIIGRQEHSQLAWVQGDQDSAAVVYARQELEGIWAEPMIVAPIELPETAVVDGAADSSGAVHLVWSDNGAVYYSLCADEQCSPAAALTQMVETPCLGDDKTAHERPVIAVDSENNVMVAWQTKAGRLIYATWTAGNGPSVAAGGCVPTPTPARDPRLVALSANQFALIFTAGENEILSLHLQDGRWLDEAVSLGQGTYPDIFVDAQQELHYTWCGVDQKVTYAGSSGSQTVNYLPGCKRRPSLAEDGQGVLHLMWSGEEIPNLFGQTVVVQPTIVESVLIDGVWTEPALVSESMPGTAAALQVDGLGTLHAIWPGTPANGGELVYRTNTPYTCQSPPQTAIGQAMLAAVTQPAYLPDDLPPTYCDNRFDDILFAPNPIPGSDQESADSVFQALADLVATAEHEALIVNMKWEKSEGNDSPGSLIAQAVRELYDNVKANPEQYPRGMSVRIVLGNVPEMQPFSLDRQVWHVMEDLRDAGLPALVDEELGWRVEVANYRGSWPHSHVKMVVVDGKRVLASGFNIAHEHFPADHPSGLGLGMVDFGLIFSGPVAQSAMAAFDDIWQASDQVSCSTLDPPSGLFWPLFCEHREPRATHPPEVLKYDVQPGSDDVAFSLYRSRAYLGADDALLAAIGAAEESIDLFQVNFSLELICGAGVVIPDMCNYEENAPNYIKAVVDVVEENQIPVRILTDQFAAEGYENRVAVQVLMEELEARGLRDLVEIHYYDGRMHSKAILIDDQFLVVGSQNFHYSAWGETLALNEYNLATENAAAVDAYQQAFDYYWQNSESAGLN